MNLRSASLAASLFALALASACSGTVAGVGAGPDGGGSGACTKDADCGTGKMCGFANGGGCSAAGTCFDAPAPGTPECLLYAPGCACDGTEVNLACNGYPSGYASKPVAHSGACGTDAGGPCTKDADCASGMLCGFPKAAGCGAAGVCVQPVGGPMCNLFTPGCACDGTTINIGCTPYPDGYVSRPLAHPGACEYDAGPGTFACGPTLHCPTTQVCKIGEGGAVGTPPSYACVDYPASCAADHSCGCVKQALGAQLCSADASGDVTVTFEYP